jgi:hypothetical protein
MRRRHRPCTGNGGAGTVQAGPEVNVLDLIFLAATAGFFFLGLAYVRGCDRL